MHVMGKKLRSLLRREDVLEAVFRVIDRSDKGCSPTDEVVPPKDGSPQLKVRIVSPRE